MVMPAAVLAPAIGAGIGGAGSIASGIGGKKAANKANQLGQQQLQLQQNQFGLTKQQYGAGNQAVQPATNFWTDLLKGGQAAQQAIGPYASLIGQAAQGARQNILGSTPRGGEQNLALAQNTNQASNNIARLYAGMQPTAASNLSQIAGEYFGSGSAVNPGANVGAAAQNYLGQQQMAHEAGQGYGSLLYNAINKLTQGRGSSSSPGNVGGV